MQSILPCGIALVVKIILIDLSKDVVRILSIVKDGAFFTIEA